MALNKVLLIGNVGKEPEVRHLDGGASVANFTLATSERFKDKTGEIKETTEWHNIVAWRQLAELSEKYIHKGSQIFVEGSIRTRSYQDGNGQTRYVTEIMASSIQLLGRRGDTPGSPADEGASASAPMQSSSYQSTRRAQPAAAPAPAPAQPQQVSEPAPEEPIELNTDKSEDDLPF
jgi:single-strand DNA-binding protein